jgi:hypothetical protein
MFLRKCFVMQPGDAFLPRLEQIRKRAYAIYLERGREHGHDLDDWLTAEEEFEFDIRFGVAA